MAAETKSLYIKMYDGRDVIVDDIPADAKITFGPLVPGSRQEQRPVLRIYQSEKVQLACFQNVQEFRELSLSVKRRYFDSSIVKEVTDSRGNTKSVVNSSVKTDWEDITKDERPDLEYLAKKKSGRNIVFDPDF